MPDTGQHGTPHRSSPRARPSTATSSLAHICPTDLDSPSAPRTARVLLAPRRAPSTATVARAPWSCRRGTRPAPRRTYPCPWSTRARTGCGVPAQTPRSPWTARCLRSCRTKRRRDHASRAQR
jgi:hypothetical protein